MKHPTSKKVYKVIEAFEKILPMIKRKNHLDMLVCDVNNRVHSCGTVHCHGGWYAIAKRLHLKAHVDFQDGSLRMAKDLGFKNDADLMFWAKENPTIWGNKNGNSMFCDKCAFFHPTKRPKGAKTLQHIIDHWKEVAGRLGEMEEIKNPQYKNITKELAKLPIEETSDIINQNKEVKV